MAPWESLPSYRAAWACCAVCHSVGGCCLVAALGCCLVATDGAGWPVCALSVTVGTAIGFVLVLLRLLLRGVAAHPALPPATAADVCALLLLPLAAVVAPIAACVEERRRIRDGSTEPFAESQPGPQPRPPLVLLSREELMLHGDASSTERSTPSSSGVLLPSSPSTMAAEADLATRPAFPDGDPICDPGIDVSPGLDLSWPAGVAGYSRTAAASVVCRAAGAAAMAFTVCVAYGMRHQLYTGLVLDPSVAPLPWAPQASNVTVTSTSSSITSSSSSTARPQRPAPPAGGSSSEDERLVAPGPRWAFTDAASALFLSPALWSRAFLWSTSALWLAVLATVLLLSPQAFAVPAPRPVVASVGLAGIAACAAAFPAVVAALVLPDVRHLGTVTWRGSGHGGLGFTLWLASLTLPAAVVVGAAVLSVASGLFFGVVLRNQLIHCDPPGWRRWLLLGAGAPLVLMGFLCAFPLSAAALALPCATAAALTAALHPPWLPALHQSLASSSVEAAAARWAAATVRSKAFREALEDQAGPRAVGHAALLSVGVRPDAVAPEWGTAVVVLGIGGGALQTVGLALRLAAVLAAFSLLPGSREPSTAVADSGNSAEGSSSSASVGDLAVATTEAASTVFDQPAAVAHRAVQDENSGSGDCGLAGAGTSPEAPAPLRAAALTALLFPLLISAVGAAVAMAALAVPGGLLWYLRSAPLLAAITGPAQVTSAADAARCPPAAVLLQAVPHDVLPVLVCEHIVAEALPPEALRSVPLRP